MELRLETASLLELAEESTFIRRHGSESCLERIKNGSLRKVDRNIFERLLLLGDLRRLLLGNS
jgi:hypothetical protein